MRKIGFIGCGNMGSAILKGILSAGLYEAESIYVHTSTQSKMEELHQQFKVNIVASNLEVVKQCDLIFLAVKPHLFDLIFEEIAPEIKNQVFISIAAGQSLNNMLKMSGNPSTKLIRTMPNTPVMVMEGMSACCANKNCNQSEIDEVNEIFSSFGRCEWIPEKMMDAIPAVSGSSPAYVFMMINALSDGAVRDGMPRDQALIFAAQAVLGSAKMVLESGLHPEKLKDMVCSPNGTTIEAVAKLEETGFRNSILSAMKACSDRLKEMSK